MAVTKEDLREFHRFAEDKLNDGGDASLVELASEWESQRRESDATMADIRQSHAEIDAGQVSSVREAFADVRKQLGIP